MSAQAQERYVKEAYDEGATAARNAASWITDGNDSDESRRAKLEMIEEGRADDLIRMPNLSGEFADDPTPQSLYDEITGLDHRERISENEDADGEIMNALADAYEQGVSDTFEDACVSELNRWLS